MNSKQNTNYNDGATMVAQCPIVPQENYLYEFSIPDQVCSSVFMKILTHVLLIRRERFGIMLTSKHNIAMASVAPSLCTILTIPISICTTSMMVSSHTPYTGCSIEHFCCRVDCPHYCGLVSQRLTKGHSS